MNWTNKRKFALVGIDLGIAVVSYYAMMFLNLLSKGITPRESVFRWWNLVAFCVLLFLFRFLAKIYHCIWRYANSTLYLRLVLADAAACAVFLLIRVFWKRINLGGIYTIALFMTVLLVTLCSRFLYQRVYAAQSVRTDKRSEPEAIRNHQINVVIVGAGNVGASLAESLKRNSKSHYKPCCFVDKDIQKIGNEINGLPIYADDDAIVDKIKAMPIQEIIIALPELPPSEKEVIYEKFKATGCKVKLYDYSLTEQRPANIRDFRIEDLLFRESIQLQDPNIAHFYTGKTVLVTGGGGSIGSELCRQIARQNPARLVILDIYENNAYDIQQELIRTYGATLQLDVIIASVRDTVRMEEVFRSVRPEVVIHAAAHKHVPLMENNPTEAIKNNVFGTYNCARLAEKYGVRKFLQISTDKAVNPTNIMGASKRLCEMIVQCRSDSKTEFAAVRFGNVLGSNGSVIPLFRRQIEKGGPVTLTDRRIIRYFMTIPEAVGLVLEAGVMAKNGELFVLDMGKPVKILTLAENMIQMAGYVPYQDIDIVEVGLRPGEKLYEELLMKSEELSKTDNDLIFVERETSAPTREEVEQKLEILRGALEKETGEAIFDAIRRTVPTYHDPEEVNRNAVKAPEMRMVAPV